MFQSDEKPKVNVNKGSPGVTPWFLDAEVDLGAVKTANKISLTIENGSPGGNKVCYPRVEFR